MQTPPPPPPADLPPPPPPAGLAPPPPAFYGTTVVYDQAGAATRTQSAAQVAYAGFWVRFLAAFIDSIFVAVAIFILFLVIGLIAGAAAVATGSSVDTSGIGIELVIDFIALSVSIGYYVYFWAMGQTPGMRRLGLRVADADTLYPIGFGRAAVRYLGYLLSAAVCYIGLIWAAFDPRKQGWHDKIGKTVVIYG